MNHVVNVGIWGIGRAGYGMIRSELVPLPDFRIVAGCDLIDARAAKLAAETGAKAYTDPEKFLADPNVKLVVVATRSCDHVECAITAMKSGKDVLVEKPMATCIEDVDRLYAIERQTARKLVVRHNRRFDKHAMLAKEIAASGVLGEIYEVQIRTGGYNRRADWQTLRQFGGGQLFNWGPHCIDWGLQLIGGKAQKIEATLKRLVCAGDAEDYVKIVMHGPAGAVADIEINGASLVSQPLMLVQGTQGTLTLNWDKYRLKHLAIVPPPIAADPNTQPDGAGFGNPEKLEWTETEGEIQPRDRSTFWGAVHDRIALDKPFPVTHDQAREVIRVIDTARRLSPLKAV